MSIVNTVQLLDMKSAKSADKNFDESREILQGFCSHWKQSSPECHGKCQPNKCPALMFPEKEYVPIFDVQKIGPSAVKP